MTHIFRRRSVARPARIGLALGSGSARGWAHIGVINALAEVGIRVDCVAGTSIGALVGAAYASGKTSSLERVVRELDWKKAMALFDVGLPKSGLFDGRKVTDSIREHIESGDIQALHLPFCAVSTDLMNGSEVHIRSGDVIDAVRASISIPGVFTPVKRDGMLLADGGLVNPVPAAAAREMGADYVIAVDLNHGAAGIAGVEADDASALHDGDNPSGSDGDEDLSGSDGDEDLSASHDGEDPSASQGDDDAARDPAHVPGPLAAPLAALKEKMAPLSLPGLAQARQWFSRESVPNILEVLMTSINVMEAQITEMQLAKESPDLLIRPKLGHIKLMEFHRGAEAIAEGHRAAVEALGRTDVKILV